MTCIEKRTLSDRQTFDHKAVFFFFQAEDGIRDLTVTGVQTCALPISIAARGSGDMKRLRIGFLVSSRYAQSTGHVPAVMRALSDAGVGVDGIHPTQGAVDLSRRRGEHGLYLVKKTSRLSPLTYGAPHP